MPKLLLWILLPLDSKSQYAAGLSHAVVRLKREYLWFEHIKIHCHCKFDR